MKRLIIAFSILTISSISYAGDIPVDFVIKTNDEAINVLKESKDNLINYDKNKLVNTIIDLGKILEYNNITIKHLAKQNKDLLNKKNGDTVKEENTQKKISGEHQSKTIVANKTKKVEAKQKEEKEQNLKKKIQDGKIQDGAVSKLTKKNYPKTYAKWGDKWIKRINDNLPLVALKVAEREICDKVTNVDISDSRSTPKKEAIYYADCANGQRFYLSEKDLQDFVEVMSVSEKTTKHDDYAYISTCKNAIKGRLTHPSTFDDSWINTSVHRADIGNVRVSIPFEARNSFNLLLEMEGICHFDERGLTDVTIREK